MEKRSYLSLLSGVGFSLLMMSALFVISFLLKFLTTGHLHLFYMLLFAGAGYAGYYLIKLTFPWNLKDAAAKPKDFTKLRQQVLLLAQAQKGRVAVSEVAKLTGLSLNESTTLLKDLVREGLAEVWVTEQGGLVYVFKEFFPDYKESAQDPFAVKS